MNDTEYASLIRSYDLATLRQARMRLHTGDFPNRGELLDREIARREAGMAPDDPPAPAILTIDREEGFAGIFFRLPALAIDLMLVYIPFGMLFNAAVGSGHLWALVALPFAWPLYTIVCTSRLQGQTIGRRLLGIRVVAANGSSAGLRQAVLRHLPDIIFAIAMAASIAIPLTIGAYLAAGTTHAARLASFQFQFPQWDSLDDLWDIWIWSEMVFLCLDPHRRSLHELLSGTVVIHAGKSDEIDFDASSDKSYYDWLAALLDRIRRHTSEG